MVTLFFFHCVTHAKNFPISFIPFRRFLDENFQILNYTFLKEFSEDSNDDWIISFINHANIRDEMMEHTKIIEETMRQMREKSQKK